MEIIYSAWCLLNCNTAVSTMGYVFSIAFAYHAADKCVFKICSIKTLWAVKPKAHSLPTAWNHMDNTNIAISSLPPTWSTYRGVFQCVRCSDICMKSVAFWVVYCNWLSIIICCFCFHHHIRVPTNVSEVHGSMLFYSFFLGTHWILEGVTVSPLILGGHWIPEGITGFWDSLTRGGHWFLGYSDRGSINPRTEWPGSHSIGVSLKPTTQTQSIPQTPPARKGSGDIQLIPRASL